ncbi:hypothetical protein [Paracoccus sp. (in: a-proteobacteria)]|uniref:hypothetical protein n=1 Tax=Paracoccus sp. TaxID=267 RepID=UPI002AFF3824|nr:hypothetical protein [Paracoccus sp. (in: a-proteobacteria)]
MALQYRKRIQQLYDALQDEDEGKRIEAADTLRSLVDQIVLTPVDGKVEIDVQGDLAGNPYDFHAKQKPRSGCYGVASKDGCGGRI